MDIYVCVYAYVYVYVIYLLLSSHLHRHARDSGPPISFLLAKELQDSRDKHAQYTMAQSSLEHVTRSVNRACALTRP
jgi:hypothetical protein